MITKVELYKDGSKMVYHRTNGGLVCWIHKPGEACGVCDNKRKRR